MLFDKGAILNAPNKGTKSLLAMGSLKYVGKTNSPRLRFPVRSKGETKGILCPWLPWAVHDWHEVSFSFFQHSSHLSNLDRGRSVEGEEKERRRRKDRAKLNAPQDEVSDRGDSLHWASVSVS